MTRALHHTRSAAAGAGMIQARPEQGGAQAAAAGARRGGHAAQAPVAGTGVGGVALRGDRRDAHDRAVRRRVADGGVEGVGMVVARIDELVRGLAGPEDAPAEGADVHGVDGLHADAGHALTRQAWERTVASGSSTASRCATRPERRASSHAQRGRRSPSRASPTLPGLSSMQSSTSRMLGRWVWP